jgi:hypothetical protein
MNLNYTVDENSFAVRIYMSGNNIPIIYQPNWPNGTNWISYDEASSWASLCISSILSPESPQAPSGPAV